MKKFLKVLYRVIITLVYAGVVFLGLNAFLSESLSIPVMLLIAIPAGIAISVLEVLEEKHRGL